MDWELEQLIRESREYVAQSEEPARVAKLLEEVVSLEQRSRQLIEEHHRVLEALNRISQELDRIRHHDRPN